MAVPAELPSATAVLCTRGQPQGAVRAAHSLLTHCAPDAAVWVVDQSEDDVTARALASIDDSRLHYVRDARRGLSHARNLAFQRTDTEAVLFTDDDCEVQRGWDTALRMGLLRHKRVGVVFGNVAAAPHDRLAGFVPAYLCRAPRLCTRALDKHQVEGIGACMAVRRSAWEAVGGFDAAFGAGAPLRSAEELDLVLRSLDAGHFVYETPSAQVLHHGFRSWPQGRKLIADYLYGIGAAVAKHARLAPIPATVLCVRLAERWAFATPLVDLGPTPSRALRLRAFLRGFARGLCTPLDSRGHFILQP